MDPKLIAFYAAVSSHCDKIYRENKKDLPEGSKHECILRLGGRVNSEPISSITVKGILTAGHSSKRIPSHIPEMKKLVGLLIENIPADKFDQLVSKLTKSDKDYTKEVNKVKRINEAQAEILLEQVRGLFEQQVSASVSFTEGK